jgi:hypothetical protein
MVKSGVSKEAWWMGFKKHLHFALSLVALKLMETHPQFFSVGKSYEIKVPSRQVYRILVPFTQKFLQWVQCVEIFSSHFSTGGIMDRLEDRKEKKSKIDQDPWMGA